jgi:hypothetical protein
MDWESFLKAIGSFLGGASQAGGLIGSLMGDEPEVPTPQGYKTWVENVPDLTAMVQGVMPMGYLSGVSYPTYGGYWRQNQGQSFGGMESAYPVTQEIYNSFLGGNYGLSPQNLAAQQQSALAPLSLGGLGGNVTPASVAGYGYMDPMMLARALADYQNAAYRDQSSYLSNAANIARYNQQRAQFLGGLLGAAG